ncbi:MAG: acyl carrier protein [Dehalococcoidia bacterium]|jgi:acyl carrier protein|nr:acyl carrier protein [Dehalococcoidia bacterium]MCK5180909.1 acyl carrier protein [Dehalococcoidia bacterium]TET43471.1 MAG: acyl carrier protein [Dehalococcoidia bacterium]TEU17132.1 MAG: acyl carrier protein [Dehalococcoidia bacterium]
MTVEDQVRDIVAKITRVDKSIITRQSTFKEIKADSLDVVQALVAVEETFGIEIPDEEAQKFQNFGDFVSYVESRVAQEEKV